LGAHVHDNSATPFDDLEHGYAKDGACGQSHAWWISKDAMPFLTTPQYDKTNHKRDCGGPICQSGRWISKSGISPAICCLLIKSLINSDMKWGSSPMSAFLIGALNKVLPSYVVLCFHPHSPFTRVSGIFQGVNRVELMYHSLSSNRGQITPYLQVQGQTQLDSFTWRDGAG
jgi:hypothetical protein